jgi:catechol-2,3-dioxygenase
MTIHSINHVQLGFPAGEQAQLRHFYGTLLGLTEWRPSDGKTLRFHAGRQRVDLVPSESWTPPAALPHIAFEVQNLPGLRAKLLEAGHLLDESRPLAGHLRFYVNDPAGNGLEFLEPHASEEGAL